jgi:hypothetical protein
MSGDLESLTLDIVVMTHHDVGMPDLDRLPRGVRRGWSRVADAVRGAQDPGVVGNAIEKAIARTIRLLPADLGWLVDLDRAIGQSRTEGTIDALDAYVSSLNTRVARGVEAAFVDEARRLAMSNGFYDVRSLIVGGLLAMPEKLCLAAVAPELVGSSFMSYRQMRSYTDSAMAFVNAGAIADQIIRDGFHTTRVKAPRTRLDRPGTKVLLHAPIT